MKLAKRNSVSFGVDRVIKYSRIAMRKIVWKYTKHVIERINKTQY